MSRKLIPDSHVSDTFLHENMRLIARKQPLTIQIALGQLDHRIG